mmetsp:Transcript_10655/g.20674  ORF Transcript_10655/g.20674 Transcript_10655/m.20674 type:complete len:284 (+) Transcript_10655:114-965(+)
MGQSCAGPGDDEDSDSHSEVLVDSTLRPLPLPVAGRRRLAKGAFLDTASPEAMIAETNPFKDEVNKSNEEFHPNSRLDCASMAEPDPEEQGPPSQSTTKAEVHGQVALLGRVVLRQQTGQSSVLALAFPYPEAPVLGEIVCGEEAESLSECGEYIQLRWKGLKVWISKADTMPAPKRSTDLPARADSNQSISVGGAIVPASELNAAPASGTSAVTAYTVGQAVELCVGSKWIAAKVTGILGSGFVQVRGMQQSAQAAEAGVEAQCGVWLDHQQQKELLRAKKL